MHLRRLTTLGLKGLQKFPRAGVDFPFDEALGGAEVVAVIGPNGDGKTTFLEAPLAALYGQFPSRATAVPKLAAFADGKDAEIEAQIDVDGRGRYRAYVAIDAVTGDVAGVLELTTPDGLTRRLNDGKISTFRQAVAREFPPLGALLASAFAAQNDEGSFAELDKKARKELFLSLLGLGVYEQRAATARACAAAIEARLATLREIRDRLAAQTTPDEAARLVREADDLAAFLASARVDQRDRAEAIASADRRVADTRGAAARAEEIGAERQACEAERDRLRGEAEALGAETLRQAGDLADAVRRLSVRQTNDLARLAQAIDRLPVAQALEAVAARERQAIERQLAEALADRETRRANNRDLLATAATVRAAAAALDALEAEQRAVDAQRADARPAIDEAERGVTRTSAARDRERAWPDRLAAAQQKAALIARVPFGEACAKQGCEFVQDAVTARDSIAACEAGVARLAAAETALTAAQAHLRDARTAWVTADARGRELAAGIAEHHETRRLAAQLETAEARIVELDADVAQLRDKAAADLAAVQTRLDDAVRDAGDRLHDLDAERDRVNEAARDERRALERAFEDAQEARAARRDAITARIDEIREALDAIATRLAPLAGAKADHADAVLAQAEARTQATDALVRVARLEEQQTALAARRLAFDERLAERRAAAEAVERWTTELLDWRALARILGADGLPVLEIDAAGPGVSALANDLLQASFGSRFVLQLVTQTAKADGQGLKEVFDVQVFDASQGGAARDLSTLSGGERVVVDEALKSAIALHHNQRNEQPIRTCWRDETIGALDPASAVAYVQMLRRVRERGAFRRLYFISHNLEAARLADAIIRIADGRLSVLFPPFTEEAVA